MQLIPRQVRPNLVDAHAYPPVSWRALREAVEVLLDELDSYEVKLGDWLRRRESSLSVARGYS